VKVTPECDIFSAGVILHFLLLKRPLFEGKNCDEMYNNNRKMKFDLDAPFYKQVDPAGMDLLRKMLVVDPTQRIKASEILAHPFLTEFYQEKEVLSPASTRYSCDVTFSEVELYF
jgi:serine/threonine protein kinase